MEGLNNKKSKDSTNNVKKDETSVEEKIDYVYGDLSDVPTATLKVALRAYQNFNEKSEALSRIEVELLGRKELEVDENLFSEN